MKNLEYISAWNIYYDVTNKILALTGLDTKIVRLEQYKAKFFRDEYFLSVNYIQTVITLNLAYR